MEVAEACRADDGGGDGPEEVVGAFRGEGVVIEVVGAVVGVEEVQRVHVGLLL